MSDAWYLGVAAYESGLTKQDNPYSYYAETNEWDEWEDGFNYASFGE